MNGLDDFNYAASMLHSYWPGEFADTDRKLWFMALKDCDKEAVEKAVIALSEKEGQTFRPSLSDLKTMIRQFTEKPAPDWTRARRLCRKAVNKTPSNYYELTRLPDGPSRIREWQLRELRDADWGNPIVAEWLTVYGIKQFAREGDGDDGQWVEKRQRESYEKFIAHNRETEPTQRVLGEQNGRTSPTSLPRPVDAARGLPAPPETIPSERPQEAQPYDPYDF